jgi:hypothetical protein
MQRHALLLILAVALSGCGGDEGRRRIRSGERPAPTATEPGSGDAGVEPPVDDAAFDGRAHLASRTVAEERFQTVAIREPASAPAEPRPRRRRAIDVDLQGAPFEDAARLLSEVGDFPIVVEAPSAGTVHATLRRVDAWDALVAIAHAKGLVVTWQRGIAVVRAP